MAEKKDREQWIADELQKLADREAKLTELLDHLLPIATGGTEDIDTPFGRVRILPDTTKNAGSNIIKTAAELRSIQERRARYLALDAPARTELTGKDGAPLNGPGIYVPKESDD